MLKSELVGIFRRQGAELTAMIESAEAGMRRLLLEATVELADTQSALQATDPEHLLEQGYTLAVRPDGSLSSTLLTPARPTCSPSSSRTASWLSFR